jgi:hypothetical protein
MRGRVIAVDPAPEDAYRRASGLERTAMRLAVDTAGEAANHDQPSSGQLAPEHPRDLRAVRRARSSADDRDRRAREELRRRSSAEKEAYRRVVDRPQKGRESRIRPGKETQAARG